MTSLNGQESSEERLAAVLGVLASVLPRCSCGEIGVWRWEDTDGVEHKCDVHKDENFYVYGPELQGNVVQARTILEREQAWRTMM